MCNPLEITDVYRYDKKDIKRARREHTKKRKMVKIEDPFDLHSDNSLDQRVSENMAEGWLQYVNVLTQEQYDRMISNGEQRDDTLYLVSN